MLESLNYSFRNPKKHNLSNLPHQTVEKLQKNHGVLWGPQLGKQRWRPRLGILRVNVFYTLPFMARILLHLICISTYIIVIYSHFLYTNKEEERENRVTIYSCYYCYYCLLIQDQSVIVRRSVHSSNSITLSSLSSCCRYYSHTAYATIFDCCVHEWTTYIKYVYFMRKY